ncbi:MAG: hypothetical protein IKQ46_17040 [Bacteroidales bacterium]|nr:hypothetical protein [Bacteroidales bacterium]
MKDNFKSFTKFHVFVGKSNKWKEKQLSAITLPQGDFFDIDIYIYCRELSIISDN